MHTPTPTCTPTYIPMATPTPTPTHPPTHTPIYVLGKRLIHDRYHAYDHDHCDDLHAHAPILIDIRQLKRSGSRPRPGSWTHICILVDSVP